MLFCRGRRELLTRAGVAVVGTRRATLAGERWTYEAAGRIAEAGFAVISGLAEGIDTAAHRGALAVGGDTVAVLGCGPDVSYPRRNRDLMEEIASRGLLVSEHPPGSPPLRAHFPERNRMVSALALGVVVVEAGRSSGALITAGMARKQNRPVFAVPGAPGAPECAGANYMIKRGEATLVEEAGEVIRLLGCESEAGSASGASCSVVGPEGGVLSLLSTGEGTPVDLVARRLGRPVSKVLGELLRLELEGRVEPMAGGSLWRRRGR
jgi:DNA processing protein